MDAFVTRKKRKAGQPLLPPLLPPRVTTRQPAEAALETARGNGNGNGDDDENAPTEVKLALLASILDGEVGQDVLLDLLLAHEGCVAAAAETFRRDELAGDTRRKRPRTSSGSRSGSRSGSQGAVIGQQTSLRGFATSPRKNTQQQQQLAVDHTPIIPSPLQLLSRRGRTLSLFDPVDVEAHTPCTLVHNFLPAETANALLREMLAETPTFSTPRFRLFEQVVTSPHTMGFFVDGLDADTKDSTQTPVPYLYNGSRIKDVRSSTPQLASVRPVVQAAVNAAVQQRIATRYPGGRKLSHQHPGPWRPNAAFVNCYSGAQQSVGWHSDQLTYLGPRAVIGSLSLGVARDFRVRRVLPRDLGDRSDALNDVNDDDNAAGQISINLPHNSLLIMHAEMQEQWKHCIAPAVSIDLHPIAGNKRINITYRDYRPEFHPNNTPRCRCGISAVLRVVMKKRDNYGRYFWMCHAGNIPEKTGCSFFQWAEFDDDGNPIWGKNSSSRRRAASMSPMKKK